jgi:hypothetical protein
MPRRVVGLLIAFALGACSSGQPPAGTIPTLDEARAFVSELVALARAGDFEGLCERADDGNCERQLEFAGRDSVPPDPPTVVGTRIVPTVVDGTQTSLGGIVFILCGVNAHGDHYDSEMLVAHGGDGLRAINPIYWGPTRIGDTANPVTPETFPPVTC